jgi:SAM-dependent methyltransferase
MPRPGKLHGVDARPCPACSSEAGRPVGSANGHALARCPSCRTLFTVSLPSSPAEAMDYAGYYHAANLQVPEFVERRLEEVAGEFEPYRRLGRWLDVGCGAGALMRAAARQGWTAVGTEMAEGAAKAVRADGFEVHVGELETLGLEDQSFDVVSLVEVLEHVDDPGALVLDARRLLRPGGAMYVTTPHGRGVSARLLRNRWSAVGPPEHLQLFSLPGLRMLVERAGLAVSWARTHAVNPHELLAAMRRQGDQTGGERVQSGYALNESLSESRRGVAVKEAANAVLNATRLGDAIKLAAQRPG